MSSVIDILRRRIMANIKSQKKRILTSQAENARNSSKKSAIKTEMKKFEGAIAASDATKANELYLKLVSMIDMAKSDGIFHINTCARKKSRIAKLLNSIAE
jgi:small subunit ribosomal protein S20